jgi:hypothetical protein
MYDTGIQLSPAQQHLIQTRLKLLILITLFWMMGNTTPVFAIGYENELADEADTTSVKTSQAKTSKTKTQKKTAKKHTQAPQIDSVENRKQYMETIMANPDDFELDNVSTMQTQSISKQKKQNVKKAPAKVNWDHSVQQNDTLRPGLVRKKFEQSLQANYFVAFALYNNLDPVAKNMVYQSYLKKPDIDSVTKTIGDLSK